MTEFRSSGGTRVGISLFAVGIVAIAGGYAATIIRGTAPGWAPWALALGIAATAVGLFVLGSASRGKVRPAIVLTLTLLFLDLAASFGAALTMRPDEGIDGRLLLGLPLRLAIVFYGVGFVPLLVLPVVFGLTFRDHDGEGGPA